MASEDAVLATSIVLQLIGQSFIQLCVGPGDAQLNFTGDCALQFESPICATKPDAPLVRAHQMDGIALLLPLLNSEVTDVRVDDVGELSLTIGDTKLWCGPDPAFEAWNYSGPRGELVVCTPGGHLAIWTALQ